MSDLQTDPAAPRDVYTVSRLNLEVRALLDGSFPALWVEGEISNLARPRSGHMYFSLKDDRCQVRCAMFRMHNRNLGFRPEDGMQVLAQARAGLYPERGEFQLVVQFMEEAGAGALRRAFEALKARLANEGLFEASRKRPLPAVPARIGVITSPTGAALRDVLNVLARRFPAAGVIVYPVPVQGAGAAQAIAAMIERAGARAECDVLLLVRGGGSLEDLQAFNEEVVARAIAASALPVVAGIGHETDFTIADFVADSRAPTPSAAAELVSPDAESWRAAIAGLATRLRRQAGARIERSRERLQWLLRRLGEPRRPVFDAAQRLDRVAERLARAAAAGPQPSRARLAALLARLQQTDPTRRVDSAGLARAHLDSRLHAAMRARAERRRAHLASLVRALGAYSPQGVLDRGYAIVTRAADGRLLLDPADAPPGTPVLARLARGRVSARVTEAGDAPEAVDPEG